MKSEAKTVIIGGGIIGLAIAYNLAKMGEEDIVVLEKGYLGNGSTFRCGSGIRQQFGDEANIQMMKRSVELWSGLKEELGMDVEFRQTGYLFLLYDEEELESFKKNVALQNKFGVPSRIISPEDAKELVPPLNTEGIIGAAWNHTDGKANPFKAVFAYANAAKKLGVEIYEYTKAEDIKVENSEIKSVITDKGEIKTRRVINAANAWAKLLNAKLGIDIPIEPYKHQSVKTEPIKPGQIEPMVISFKHDGVYLTQEAEQGGIIGGYGLKYGPTYDITPTYEFLRGVSYRFTQIIPSLKYVNVIRIWGGYYAETPDGNAAIGKINEINEYYIAAGFSGHGFMLAPVVGEMMAELIVNGKTKKPLWFYDPYRFERGELRGKAIQMG
ncbi:NAD(P)/FAD-dependent oxidoreductase [Palaeococcus sp. (in: euryarchaeotes)]|uniref:NAD(P)/FAD-dependent oxidoreductase n=1 Tax=Palaeococcus sp. (in: euryarchaeotes) TaxID=2820298 RepID=UPI000F170C35|nr:FAD-binding oxidoreductase [Palaeococcus sp. (in: euryarchaeotes)]MCD6558835.1 FAD-binding oxidoreductase [Palaeococcus sp. (in: euryarchaeotes)]RLF76949.1 MAG: FAD-binding oxidoreductase [Thermococci archaeon]